LSSSHPISIYILVCLEGKRHTGYSLALQQQALESFTERYPVILPPTKLYLNGLVLCPHNVIYINRILDTFFDQHLYLHTERTRFANQGKRYYGLHRSLRGFLNRYQIEEDVHMNFEALAKRQERFKKNFEKNGFFTSNFVGSQ